MKSFKLITTGLAALALAGSAFAQTSIHIAGATAFRTAALTAVQNVITVTASASSGSLTGGNAQTFVGTLNSTGNPITVQCCWTGSAAGVIDLVEGNSIAGGSGVGFIPVASAVAGNVDVGSTYSGEAGVANVAFADVSATNIANSVGSANLYGRRAKADILGAISAAKLADAGVTAGPVATVGVVPFRWVMSNLTGSGVAVPFTNITQQQAKTIIDKGYRPLDTFTGVPTDAGNFVFFVGRNEDSGTRASTYAEAALGFGPACQTWNLQVDSAGTDSLGNWLPPSAAGLAIKGLQLWKANTPVNTVPSLKWGTAGHSGYNIGPDVKFTFTTPNPVTGLTPVDTVTGWTSSSKAFFVTCTSTGDASTIQTAGGKALTYNGVDYSADAVRHGQYSQWSFEHCYYLTSATTHTANSAGTPSAVAGEQKTFADALADRVYTNDASLSGIVFSTMVVSRADTGDEIAP